MKKSFEDILVLIIMGKLCYISGISGNYVIDKGKGGGSRSHDYGNVVAEELGELDANMSGGGGC